eukprot:gene14285-biopygen557
MKWRRRRCGMPRRLFLKHFWSILEPKPTKLDSKHAPQRRVYALSVQKGPIDGTHGCAQKMYVQFPPGRLLDRAHARKMRFEGFFGVFWIQKTTTTDSKYAPQRRVYARSVQKGPIDGTH